MKDTLEKIIGKGIKSVVKLHGDASYRTYYRVYLDDGKTHVIMKMPEGASSASEEITNFRGQHNEPSFINVARFLISLGLPVPKIHRYDDEHKIMILEDVGDNPLAKFVKNGDRDTRLKWYKKAIDLLAQLQKKSSSKEETSCVALQRSFDATLLNWEFDHFRQYLIEERLGKKMKAGDRKIFENTTKQITEEIIKMPYCFTHRDFQSRNLMVREDETLVMIDFQDALKGPYVYDLVALLRDSYVELDPSLVEELVEYYGVVQKLFKDSSKVVQKLPEKGSSKVVQKLPEKGSSRVVQKQFNLVTIQRKMKDAGRFVYIDRVKKNPSFLQYIPASLKYVRNAIKKLNEPPVTKMFEMLRIYVPEWK